MQLVVEGLVCDCCPYTIETGLAGEDRIRWGKAVVLKEDNISEVTEYGSANGTDHIVGVAGRIYSDQCVLTSVVPICTQGVIYMMTKNSVKAMEKAYLVTTDDDTKGLVTNDPVDNIYIGLFKTRASRKSLTRVILNIDLTNNKQ
jgi:hypothetical protein